ncbi:MAG TPA: 50S ribosomal protein L4 [Gammaproteobacteria bacterium]|nr:50S ribosomal protein L4 [Gammaproteobacteria bacterium]
MDLQVQKARGKGKLSVSDAAFGRDFNEGLVHQAVVGYMATGRAGTRGHKSRSTARGGGVKPWRQKGTGRARSGTIRSPIWKGGGKTFAVSSVQDFSRKLNKKMYRAAMQSILSELVRQERLTVVEDIKVDSPKTKALVTKLKDLGIDNKVLIVTESDDVNLYLAARNLPYVEIEDVAGLNPVNLVGSEHIVMTSGAVKLVEELLG